LGVPRWHKRCWRSGDVFIHEPSDIASDNRAARRGQQREHREQGQLKSFQARVRRRRADRSRAVLTLRPSMAFFSPVNSACAAAPRDVYLDVYLRLFAAAPPVGLSD